MSLKKKFAGICMGMGLALAPIAGGLAVAPVAAAETITSSEIAAVTADWTAHGVPSSQQTQLLAKLQSGQPLDAFKGIAPVATETHETARNVQEIDRFADGSYVVRTLDKAPEAGPRAGGASSGGVTPKASLTGCQSSSGSGYRTFSGCTVANNFSGVINLGFIASYQLVQGQGGKITYVGNATQNCAVVSCSTPTTKIIKQNSDSEPAVAQAQSRVQAAWGSWEVWVQIRVTSTGASAHNS
ncbi:MAG: hypothetical protein LBE25_13620 [Arthrobacter sp.]|jgi:hypothetical protein|nr:hypothetical protein [Arthrobacter sp.]